VQLGQIRQAIYRKLLGIALTSRRKSFNISADFLPRIRGSLGIKGGTSIGTCSKWFQPNPSSQTPNIRAFNSCSAAFRILAVNPLAMRLAFRI
jgi:hypothetical protein